MPSIYITNDTKNAIAKLGGTFDKPDDVIKMLIVEAGYEELLDSPPTDGSVDTPDAEGATESEHLPKPPENASEAKDQLQAEIEAKYGETRRPPENSYTLAWIVDIGGSPITLWPHYSREWVHWGITKSVAEEFEEANRPLWHVFFGDSDMKRVFVPHDVFMDKFKKDYDPNEGRWKVYDHNNSDLLKRYRGYDVLNEHRKGDSEMR